MSGRLTLTLERWQLAMILGVPVAWCWGIAWQAARSIPHIAGALNDLGAELPPPTRLLIATAPWWWIVAIAATCAAFDVVRRKEPGSRRACLTFCSVLTIDVALQAFAIAAAMAPFHVLIENVG